MSLYSRKQRMIERSGTKIKNARSIEMRMMAKRKVFKW